MKMENIKKMKNENCFKISQRYQNKTNYCSLFDKKILFQFFYIRISCLIPCVADFFLIICEIY